MKARLQGLLDIVLYDCHLRLSYTRHGHQKNLCNFTQALTQKHILVADHHNIHTLQITLRNEYLKPYFEITQPRPLSGSSGGGQSRLLGGVLLWQLTFSTCLQCFPVKRSHHLRHHQILSTQHKLPMKIVLFLVKSGRTHSAKDISNECKSSKNKTSAVIISTFQPPVDEFPAQSA